MKKKLGGEIQYMYRNRDKITLTFNYYSIKPKREKGYPYSVPPQSILEALMNVVSMLRKLLRKTAQRYR